MTTKRRTIARHRRAAQITPEMIELFRRGREIQQRGLSERWEKQGGKRAEFLDVAKRLNIQLLGRGWHEVSVFDVLDGDPPAFMMARNSEQYPDFNGWRSGRELQRQLDLLARPCHLRSPPGWPR
jgi:hypothetical protein